VSVLVAVAEYPLRIRLDRSLSRDRPRQVGRIRSRICRCIIRCVTSSSSRGDSCRRPRARCSIVLTEFQPRDPASRNRSFGITHSGIFAYIQPRKDSHSWELSHALDDRAPRNDCCLTVTFRAARYRRDESLRVASPRDDPRNSIVRGVLHDQAASAREGKNIGGKNTDARGYSRYDFWRIEFSCAPPDPLVCATASVGFAGVRKSTRPTVDWHGYRTL